MDQSSTLNLMINNTAPIYQMHRINHYNPGTEMCKYDLRSQLFLLYSLIIHSSMNIFSKHSRQLTLFFPKSLRHEKLFCHSFKMAKPATFFVNFSVNKYPSTSEVICRYRSPFEWCDLIPLFTCSIGDSELSLHFQEAYTRLFLNCYNKQGIHSNLSSYIPMNQGTICAKVCPEGIQPIKGNNCGLIPYT